MTYIFRATRTHRVSGEIGSLCVVTADETGVRLSVGIPRRKQVHTREGHQPRSSELRDYDDELGTLPAIYRVIARVY